jgi:hypothetical protein
VGVESAPDRDTRADDQLALEEIRRWFDHHRELARHGMVTERDESEEIKEPDQPSVSTVR